MKSLITAAFAVVVTVSSNAGVYAEETNNSSATINSVKDNSLGVQTDFITTPDGKSLTCITVPSSTGWKQTFCY